jgi:hypothetical protein
LLYPQYFIAMLNSPSIAKRVEREAFMKRDRGAVSHHTGVAVENPALRRKGLGDRRRSARGTCFFRGADTRDAVGGVSGSGSKGRPLIFDRIKQAE